MFHGTNFKSGLDIGRSGFMFSPVDVFLKNINLEYPTEEEFKAILRIDGLDENISREDYAYEFTSRYFSPKQHIDGIYFSPEFSVSYTDISSVKKERPGMVFEFDKEVLMNNSVRFIGLGYVVYRRLSLEFLQQLHLYKCGPSEIEQTEKVFRIYLCQINVL